MLAIANPRTVGEVGDPARIGLRYANKVYGFPGQGVTSIFELKPGLEKVVDADGNQPRKVSLRRGRDAVTTRGTISQIRFDRKEVEEGDGF